VQNLKSAKFKLDIIMRSIHKNTHCGGYYMTYPGGKLMITPTTQWTNIDENEIYLKTLLRKKKLET
jgi:hypothetical protein